MSSELTYFDFKLDELQKKINTNKFEQKSNQIEIEIEIKIPLPQPLFEVRWNETPESKCQRWKCKIVQ